VMAVDCEIIVLEFSLVGPASCRYS
jgi:hypothetical protein